MNIKKLLHNKLVLVYNGDLNGTFCQTLQCLKKMEHHDYPSDQPVVICAIIRQHVLVSWKAEAAGVMLRAAHIPFYGLSAGNPKELSGLILSAESTCQDLFATGYFESDISDDPLTCLTDGETLLK